MHTKIAILLTSSTATILLVLLLVILRMTDRRKAALLILAGAASAVSLSIILYLLIRRATSNIRRRFSVQRRLSLNTDTNPRLQFSFLRKAAGLPSHFPYKDLQTATDNFATPIGHGSSGSIFKGILDDGTTVAVKRIDRQSERGDRDFHTEIAAIAAVQHVNLVRLLGYCLNPCGTHLLLVYEFAPNGSLEKWIFPSPSENPPQFLPWATRVRVAVEVAKALAYLHHHCRSRVLHLDVKPENVLLDQDFHALVTDFGLSKTMGRDESRVITSQLRGTKGYLAPEWLVQTGVTEKSDVYSYGMVLLEMVGGRRNCLLVEGIWSYFPATVAEKVRQRRVMDVVDGRMGLGEEDEEEVKRLVYVALWCIQEEKKIRPSMERVVDMLEGRMGVLEEPPETRMIMAEYLDVDDIEAQALALQRMPEAMTYSFAMTILSGR